MWYRPRERIRQIFVYRVRARETLRKERLLRQVQYGSKIEGHLDLAVYNVDSVVEVLSALCAAGPQVCRRVLGG